MYFILIIKKLSLDIKFASARPNAIF